MTGKVEEVRGRQVVIRFDGGRCIHSRNCVLGRPDVFVPNVEGEWIHPDRATPDEVAHLALVCPSGAITYERLDGGPQEAPPKVNTVASRLRPLRCRSSTRGIRPQTNEPATSASRMVRAQS